MNRVIATKKISKIIFPFLVLVFIAAYQYLDENDPSSDDSGDDVARIAQAYNTHHSGLWVSVGGPVVRALSDDTEGSRHQRFIVKLSDGNTVLVAHNIDIAKRVPLTRGDRVGLRGRYEWNDRGGVIHWTHHDPDNRQSGGWIEHNEKRYR